MAPILRKNRARKRDSNLMEDSDESHLDYLTFCQNTKCFGKYYVFSMGDFSRTYEKDPDPKVPCEKEREYVVVTDDDDDDDDDDYVFPMGDFQQTYEKNPYPKVPRAKEREIVIDTDDDDGDDDDDDDDNEYIRFLNNLEQHEFSYAFRGKGNNAIPVGRTYERESSSEDDQEPVYRRGSHKQPQSSRKGKKNNPGKFLRPGKKRCVNGIFYQKTDQRMGCDSDEEDIVEEDRGQSRKKSRRVVGHQKSTSKKKKGGDRIDPAVEILDALVIYKDGNSGPFVSGKDYSFLSPDEDNLGQPCGQSEYRKRVLDLLKKPFDKDEYVRHGKEFRNGSYKKFHPDLAKELKKHRHKKGKRLNILRGFFFWLQNLTLQRAFKPWKDKECLAIEPGSV